MRVGGAETTVRAGDTATIAGGKVTVDTPRLTRLPARMGAGREAAEGAGRGAGAGEAGGRDRSPQQGRPAQQFAKHAARKGGTQALFGQQGPAGVDQLPVGHVCGAGRLAGAAAQASIQVPYQGGPRFQPAARQSLHERDATAWGLAFHGLQAIGGTMRQAEAALHAAVGEFQGETAGMGHGESMPRCGMEGGVLLFYPAWIRRPGRPSLSTLPVAGTGSMQ